MAGVYGAGLARASTKMSSRRAPSSQRSSSAGVGSGRQGRAVLVGAASSRRLGKSLQAWSSEAFCAFRSRLFDVRARLGGPGCASSMSEASGAKPRSILASSSSSEWPSARFWRLRAHLVGRGCDLWSLRARPRGSELDFSMSELSCGAATAFSACRRSPPRLRVIFEGLFNEIFF
jgi:hypothetical protein